ncbi:hypothetical protein H9P43_007867 [Blastocladiella emersonii ATCC 22665]|nr:hypothetical protein H9P43_007867 [Blastocladiella emersonii ATCC 22665]
MTSSTDLDSTPGILKPALQVDDRELAADPNLARFLLARIAAHPSPATAAAFVDALAADTDRVTYADLADRIHALAAGLASPHSRVHVRKGDRVAVVAPNNTAFPVVALATAALGVVAALVNPLYTEEEMAPLLEATKVKAVFTVRALIPTVKQALAHAGIAGAVVVALDGGDEDDDESVVPLAALYVAGGRAPVVATDPHDVAFICFSSGTTGKSKAVQLSHRNIAINVLQLVQHDYGPQHRDGDVMDAVLPFFHIYGLTVLMLTGVYLHNAVVMLPRFDFVQWLTMIQTHMVTISHVAPPILVAVAKHPVVDKFDLSSLRWITSGAAPLGAELQASVAKRINTTIKQGFGMSEASPVTHFTTHAIVADPATAKYGTVGTLLPSVYALLLDTETQQPVTSPRHTGELLIHGPNVMLGYLDHPEANAETLVVRDDSGGRVWLRTGDVAMVDDDGHLVLVDRIKELIKFKGFQVPPAELEALLLAHPKVADAAVIGMPDDEAGELPLAFVVVKPEVQVGEELEAELKAYVAQHVAPFKKLRGGVRFVPSILKSATGKLLRREYRAQITAEIAGKKFESA